MVIEIQVSGIHQTDLLEIHQEIPMFQEIMVTKIAETDTAIRHNQDTTTVETEITRHQHLNQAEVTIMAASVHPIPEIWAAADLDPAVAQEE